MLITAPHAHRTGAVHHRINALAKALDQGLIAKLLARAKAGEALEITLCGERLAPTFVLQSSPWWNRLQRRFTAPPPQELLLTL